MKLQGYRILVAGATGAVGTALADALYETGAHLCIAGRSAARLADRACRWGECPALRFDADDLAACAALAEKASQRLQGLDAVFTAFEAVAFGPVPSVGVEVVEHLMTVNALAPMAVLRGALRHLGTGGVMGAITGMVVDRPQPGLAAYCASKAALSSWLTAVRAEQRSRGVTVLDVRLPYLDTGCADRAVGGIPPECPPSADLCGAVHRIVGAMASGGDVVRPQSHASPQTVL
ncbi:SDR family oxidoreductase [Actinacidiphila glaucinigra]|uniref:SDR family NAD(P)-dependent oxidoreductase n=1 Tax=Actinacidiphila glaucinigra TaxID=235986 RepID=UPI0033F078E0